MFDELGDGVYRRRYESLDLNIGVVVGVDGVLIVDTRASHRQADELREELRRLTDLPVRWVINTHWHWDHCFGNARFDAAEVWGHELCQITLEVRGEEMKAAAKQWLPPETHQLIDEVVIKAPNKTFSERASLDIGRTIEMSYHGLAHTDADIVVRVLDASVGFLGDLVEEGGPPSFGDSHPVAWPLTLMRATADLPGVVVPGHGDIVDRSFVQSQHEELVAVAELATSFVTGEISLDEASGGGPYPEEVMRGAMIRAQATHH
jgi:glyoxylase-like metal-dependent hydrolase (beta-lactamase superfamily II)